MMFLLDLRRCLLYQKDYFTIISIHPMRPSAVKTLCFSRKFIAVVSREQLLLLEQNLYQLLMVINPKPDPPVVTILDSNPGLVV
jgi:hypothetical protein